MKYNKNILITSLAVLLAIATLVGGTFAYLKSTTDDVVNTFQANQVTVELTETTDDYQIIPGTSQEKDPKVTVQATVPAYVYVIVEDRTVIDGKSFVQYALADGWLPLEGYEDIYYREVTAADDAQEFYVLEDNTVSYDAALENTDMVKADGTLQDGIALTFRAKAIQKEPFNNPADAYEEKLKPVALTFEYQGNDNFGANTYTKEDGALLVSAGAATDGFICDDSYYRDSKYIFSIQGMVDQDRKLSFDFSDKENQYEDFGFVSGFGGFGDTYLMEGTYTDFTLVGDYYPITLTVKHTKGSAIPFETFTGSLTQLVEYLSTADVTLKANTVYDEQFEITMLWPWQTECTDACYVTANGNKELYMDYADTEIGMFAYDISVGQIEDQYLGKFGSEFWADVEISVG